MSARERRADGRASGLALNECYDFPAESWGFRENFVRFLLQHIDPDTLATGIAAAIRFRGSEHAADAISANIDRRLQETTERQQHHLIQTDEAATIETLVDVLNRLNLPVDRS